MHYSFEARYPGESAVLFFAAYLPLLTACAFTIHHGIQLLPPKP